MRCAGACSKRLPDWPSPWLAAGKEFCSADCARAADNGIHSATRNAPSDRWLADHDARAERRRLEQRRAS